MRCGRGKERERGNDRKFSVGGRKSVVLLEHFQASPAHPSDRNSINNKLKMKTLEL